MNTIERLPKTGFSALLAVLLFLPQLAPAASNPELQELAQAFWKWRVVTQPATPDDILRVERPDGWHPDFSASAIETDRRYYGIFRKRLQDLSMAKWSRADSVDYLCLRAAIERVHWELDVLRQPFRNPDFYVQQTLGALYELLIIHTPMQPRRARNLILRLQSIPKTIADARQNLSDPVAPFAKIALENLHNVEANLAAVARALQDDMPADLQHDLETATAEAIAALTGYRQWLQAELPEMSPEFSIGRQAYEYFLKNIALIPHSPEALLQQGQLEWRRAVAFETFETLRNKDVPQPKIFASAEVQIEQAKKDEQAIRDFLEAHEIMTVPDWLQHYVSKRIPGSMRPLRFMGVEDDLTSPTRLDEDAVRYIIDPAPGLSYFRKTMALDPRPLIVHEGIPGHYYQLARSWRNPDPVRRHFVDSGPIEGIGLYVEELLLQFGLFDDQPHTREIIYNFMRLRALRVEVDIQLALGNFRIPQAADYLATIVPMDKETAIVEAGFFAYNPGQAISYQIGKLQILQFLSDAKITQGDNFRLRDFHDYLMVNGNVPIALLRWEYLGLRDEIEVFFQ